MSARLPLDETLTSQLFPRLFEGVSASDDRPLVVLNVGPASSETVRFFGHFRCRLLFVEPEMESLSAAAAADGDDYLPDDRLEARVADQFGIPDGLAVDLLLFWDSLNQLHERALAALSRVLSSHVHADSRGHGYIIHSRKQSLAQRCYGIMTETTFRRLVHGSGRPLANPCTRARLDSRLTALAVERSVLHGDGHLEVLLRPWQAVERRA